MRTQQITEREMAYVSEFEKLQINLAELKAWNTIEKPKHSTVILTGNYGTVRKAINAVEKRLKEIAPIIQVVRMKEAGII